MDEESELRKFKWLAVAVLIFLVTGWFAVEEMRYAAFGAAAEAGIVEARQTERSSGRRGRKRPVLAVRYTFQEAGGASRTEIDEVSPDWTPPDGSPLETGSKVRVQYLSGSPGKSRLAGHSHPVPLAIFLACLAGLAGFAIWLWRHASQAVHGPARRRRR